jgi:DNA-binding Lrp family transcriptional regulator
MSRVAFVLIETEAGETPSVHEGVGGLEYVTEIHGIMGEFDLIARVDVEDADEVMDVVIEDIRAVGGVVETETLMTTEPWEK